MLQCKDKACIGQVLPKIREICVNLPTCLLERQLIVCGFVVVIALFLQYDSIQKLYVYSLSSQLTCCHVGNTLYFISVVLILAFEAFGVGGDYQQEPPIFCSCPSICYGHNHIKILLVTGRVHYDILAIPHIYRQRRQNTTD